MGMSAGRVGIGSDWVNFNADETRRQEAFDSKLDLLLKAYRQKAGDPPLVFDNDFDRGRLTGRMMPAPYRDGGPQLAIGTNTDATIDDVAARGLALFLGPCPLPDALAKFARHRAALVAAGFSAAHVDDATAKSLVTRYVIVGPTEDEAWQAAERLAGRSPLIDRSKDPRSLRELSQVPLDEVARDLFPRNVLHVRGWMTVGTPDSVTTQLRAYVEQGVRHLNTRFTVGTYNPDLVQRSFDLFVDEVLPALEPELFRGPSLQQIAPEHRPDADVMAVPAQPRADLPRPTFVAGSPVPANS
jgi:alkanesulfonate monooxygenase SsuD/methylene tetrahydromethanopterin reductase-like flavin-dependent oxidoreductase (luciferase family)